MGMIERVAENRMQRSDPGVQVAPQMQALDAAAALAKHAQIAFGLERA